MALAERSMGLFFSDQIEEEAIKKEGTSKDMAAFKVKMEKTLIKVKLAGQGPWADLFQKKLITQVERDLMVTCEAASLPERLAIFKKV